MRDFPGTYDEYLASCGDDHLDQTAVVLKAKREKSAEPEKDTTSYAERKKQANRAKQLPVLRDKVVAAIEAAEARKAEIHAMWCERDFYEKTPNDRIEEIAEEERALIAKIESLMTEWESLEKELAGS